MAQNYVFLIDPHVEVTAQKLRDWLLTHIISFIGDAGNRQDSEEEHSSLVAQAACCNAGICLGTIWSNVRQYVISILTSTIKGVE